MTEVAPSYFAAVQVAEAACIDVVNNTIPAVKHWPHPITNQEKAKILSLSQMMVPSDSTSVINFGNDIRSSMDSFADDLINASQSGDVEEIKGLIDSFIKRASELNFNKILKKDSFASRIFVFVNTQDENISEFKEEFGNASDALEKLSRDMNHRRKQMAKQSDALSRMSEEAEKYYIELQHYVAAAEMVLMNAKKELESKTGNTSAEDLLGQQRLLDLDEQIDQVQSKVNDLKTSAISAAQTIPQIRMIEKTNRVLQEQIASIANIVLPDWKKQYAIGLSMVEQQKASSIVDDFSAANKTKNNVDLKSLQENQINALKNIDIAIPKTSTPPSDE